MKKPTITVKTTYVVYFLLVLFTVAYTLLSHEGIYYTDDITYTAFAVKFLNGNFEISDPLGYTFIHRLTVILPLAFFYSLFGINIFSYTIWPLVCTLGCLTITYLVSKTISNIVAVFAMLFLSLNFYFIYFSNILYPDNIVAFFSLLSATLLYFKQGANGWKAVIWGTLFSLFLFFAFLAKETAVLFIPVYILKFLIDHYNKQNKDFWTWVITISMLLTIFYFGWYYFETGNPFYRLAEINRANFTIPNFITQPHRSMVYRLTLGPIYTLINTGTFPLVVFLYGNSWLSGLKNLEQNSYWTFLGLSGLVSLWFASTSYSNYNPINLDGRMYNLLIAPLAISAASGFEQKLANKKYTITYTLLFIIAAIILQNKMSLVYVLLSLYFAIHTLFLLNKNILPTILTASMIAFTFAVRPTYFAIKQKTLFYEEHLIILKLLQNSNIPSTVFVPSYLHNSLPFFYKYKPVENLDFKVHGNKITTHKNEFYLILNKGITDQPPFSYYLSDNSLHVLYPNRILIKEAGPIKLYKLLQ